MPHHGSGLRRHSRCVIDGVNGGATGSIPFRRHRFWFKWIKETRGRLGPEGLQNERLGEAVGNAWGFEDCAKRCYKPDWSERGWNMDKKAKDILFKTYWGVGGWRKRAHTTSEDFAYANAKGLMFGLINLDLVQCFGELLALRERIPLEKAARGFLSSLSSRRLDWRSGLASLHEALEMEDDSFSFAPGHKFVEKNVDLDLLNFERIKWGGVRHGDLVYTWFDLQQLEKEKIPEPSPEDIAIFETILTTIATSAPNDTPETLEKRLTPVLKSSKDEREVLIEILACVGVLEARLLRPGDLEWRYVGSWRGEDQYNGDVVKKLFGNWLA